MRDKNGFPKSFSSLSPQDVHWVKDSIDQMVELLIKAMKPRFRREFRGLLHEDYVLISNEDGDIIVEEWE